ncbi:hypothetical protein [Pallidibacillus pasinlerensis]|uniref:Uncharacterized protein n=1 Tax=Pallidibacillus pasinlerensis TaxID=2703818 RepID=A0ABX0A568_9BACI|nr:hypothetical protein [Pallidibacillus pasinlerensis]NCU18521.1 hypothetical protein [Pallidibacillus pasinlerensis]
MGQVTLVNKSFFKSPLFNGSIAVLIAVTGTTFYNEISDSIPVESSRIIEPKANFIKMTSIAYTNPEPKAKSFLISGAFKGGEILVEPNKTDTSSVSEVEYGTYNYQVSDLKPLPTPMRKINNMEEFLKIYPKHITEVENGTYKFDPTINR